MCARIHREGMLTNQQKEFVSKLGKVSKSQSLHQTFSDWLEIAALSLHQLPYQSGELEKDAAYEALEAQYMERIKPYDKAELTSFSELLAITISVHHNSYSDFLGEIAGEAELLNKRGGQFFTPYPICCLMTKMSFGNVRAQVKEKGILTVGEPAVGSGALVIASAEEVASQEIDPRVHLQFDCTDVSRDAFNMAYIQLSALGLQAIVHHGDTLSGEYWESRPTPQLRLFHQWLEQQQCSERRVQAIRALMMTGGCLPEQFTEEEPVRSPAEEEPLLGSPLSETLFDLKQFSGSAPTTKRSRPQPDVVLDRQMDLFT